MSIFLSVCHSLLACVLLWPGNSKVFSDIKTTPGVSMGDEHFSITSFSSSSTSYFYMEQDPDQGRNIPFCRCSTITKSAKDNFLSWPVLSISQGYLYDTTASLIVDTRTFPLASMLPNSRASNGEIFAFEQNTLAADPDSLASADALMPTSLGAFPSTLPHETDASSVSVPIRTVSQQNTLDTGKSNISITATSVSKISEASSTLQSHKSNDYSSTSPISVETSNNPRKSDSSTLRLMRIWVVVVSIPLWWTLPL